MLKKLFSTFPEKSPNGLVPKSIHFRAYHGQMRNTDIWYLIFDLCHYYEMKPQQLLRYLIISHHDRIFGRDINCK